MFKNNTNSAFERIKLKQNANSDYNAPDQVYKEQQETKLLRLKYENILDKFDSQIEKLETFLGKIAYNKAIN